MDHDMRLHLMIVLCVLLGTSGRPALANCLIIDQVDKLHILQNRLSQNPDTGLFPTDIRQMRMIARTLSDRDVVKAVDGNTLMGQGARFARLMRDTRTLLQSVSLDDPASVTPHFTSARRKDLQAISNDLKDLRCTDDQVAVAESDAAENALRGNSDASSDVEDMQQVAETLSRISQEVFQLRSLLVLIGVIAASMILTPVIRHWLIVRQRRAKRHTTTYATHYDGGTGQYDGMLLDVNCYGTKLRHAPSQPLEVGADVKVRIDAEWTQGTVMWSNAHYSGVQFKRAISLEDVAAIRKPQD